MGNYKKVMAMGLAFAMMGSTVAFAEQKEAQALLIATQETDSIIGQEEGIYTNQRGTIVSVTEVGENAWEVFMDNETGGLRFMVSSETVLLDRKTGDSIKRDQLTEGMEIAVIYPTNSPMGMSMPPFLGQVSAVVVNAEAGDFAVGYFNQNLLSEKDQLKLNLGEDTVIKSILDLETILTAEDVKEKNALVFYDFTTRSIPAQTTPSFIFILEERETSEEEQPQERIALRNCAEEKGYEVKWQGKEKPILIEKGEEVIQILLGTAKYIVDGEELQARETAILVDGITYVDSDILA